MAEAYGHVKKSVMQIQSTQQACKVRGGPHQGRAIQIKSGALDRHGEQVRKYFKLISWFYTRYSDLTTLYVIIFLMELCFYLLCLGRAIPSIAETVILWKTAILLPLKLRLTQIVTLVLAS